MKSWKNAGLNGREKIEYILDYYLAKTLVIGLALSLCVMATFHFVNNKTKTVLYGAFIDGVLSVEAKSSLEESLMKLCQGDPKKQNVIIDDSFYSQEDAMTKLQVYLANAQVDVIVADREMFTLLAGYGYLQNLGELFKGEGMDGVAEFYYCPGYGEEEDSSDSWEDTQSGQGAIEAYGVDLQSSGDFNELESRIQDPVIGVAINSKNVANAISMVKLFKSQ